MSFLVSSIVLAAALQTPASPAAELEAAVAALSAELAPFECAPEPPLAVELLGPDEAGAQIVRDLEAAYGAGWLELVRFLGDSLGKPGGKDVGELRARLGQVLLGERVAWFSPEMRKLVAVRTRLSLAASQEPRLLAEIVKGWRDREAPLKLVLAPEPRSAEAVNLRRALIEGEAAAVAAAVLERRAGRDPTKLAQAKPAALAVGSVVEDLAVACGRNLAVRRLRSGGWDGVHSLLAVPPSSTEQVLHEGKLPSDQPRPVRLPEWGEAAGIESIVREDTLGELGILALLVDAGVPESEAWLAAVGWDGDRVQLLRSETGELAVVWRIAFDRPEDVQQFAGTFGKRAMGRVAVRGRSLDWVRSESVALSNALASTLANSAPAVVPNAADAASTRVLEDAWKPDAGLRPRFDSGWWIHPRHALALPAPQGWTPTVSDGQALLAGPVREGFRDYVTVLPLEDVHSRSLDSILEQRRAQISSLPGAEIDTAEVRTIAGEEAVFVRYRMRASSEELHVTMALFPKIAAPALVTAVASDATWPETVPIYDDLLARLRFDAKAAEQR